MDPGEIERAALANMAAWWTSVAAARAGRVATDEHATHVDGAGPNGVMNRTVARRAGVPAGALAEATHAHFTQGPGGPYSIFDPGERQDLAGYGFERLAALPHMVLDAPRGPTNPVRRASSTADVAAAEVLVREAFDFAPWDDTSFLTNVLRDSRAHLFLADHDGTPAAAAVGFDAAAVTGVYLVATRADARGRGLGQAVTAAAGAVTPGQAAVLQASEMGAPVYTRMGYETFAMVTVWIAQRPASS